MTDYGYSVEVPASYDEAVARARSAFRGEGFSILTEMHVGDTLDDVDERSYLIMGMWNTAVEDRSIGSDVRLAVHLPCNLVVQEAGSSSIVSALDPTDNVDVSDAQTAAAAGEAKEALDRVLRGLAQAT